MNSKFIYDIPTKVYFGENQLGNLGKEVKAYGKKCLLVYGGGSIKKIGLYDKVIKELAASNIEVVELSGVDPNPRITTVREGANICKNQKIDVILAVGGGSVIDCSKYIGAGTYYDGDPWDILLQKVDVKKCLPIITVLTLSATGSEMDCGGVITNLETQDKIGLMFEPMQPKVSFLDPTNTYTVNAYQTACGSSDMMSHICEVYFNMNEDLYMLDCVMESLMKTIIKYTPIAIKDPTNYEARANLMWTSSWAINGFINGGKDQSWSCHSMEHYLSAYYDITHGHGLAILTPRWMKYTLDETTKSKFYQFGVNVFDIDKNLDEMTVANMAIDKLSEFFFKSLGLKSTLTELNIDDTHFEEMALKASKEGLEYGFKPLHQQDIVNIYKMCL